MIDDLVPHGLTVTRHMISDILIEGSERVLSRIREEIEEGGGATVEMICDATTSRDQLLSFCIIYAVVMMQNGRMIYGCLDVQL